MKPRERGKDRTSFVGLRLTEAEKLHLEECATKLGLSLSDYIRDHLIHIKGDVTGRVERLVDD